MLTLGIDIGGSSIKAVALRDGAVLALAQSPSYGRADAGAIRENLHSVALALDAQIRPDNAMFSVDAVGLCVPGVVEAHSGCVVRSVNLPGLVGIELVLLIRSALGSVFRSASPTDHLPITLTTDATAAAVDLADRPSAGGEPITGRLAAISIGTGVGLGVVDAGIPLRVDGASAGHLGQIDVGVTLDDGTIPAGPDGGRGSLEAYCSAPALQERFGNDYLAAVATLSADDPCLRALARAIRIVHAIYRPQVVALAGGIALALRPCADVLRTMVDTELTRVADPAWALVMPERIDHAARGAALIAAAALAPNSSLA